MRAELRARLAELQGSRRRVLEAGRRERQRLERNVHDGAQQRLVALSLELGLMRASPALDDQTRLQLAKASAEVAASLVELRDVARGIYPAVLSGHGLGVALESLAARAAVPVDLEVRLDRRPPEAVEVAAYYLVSEALTNVGKHAHARTARVRVDRSADAVTVAVTDDGVGGADLLLSQYVELGLALQLLSESADGVGYLLKDRISDVVEFLDAVRRVAAGGSVIDPTIVSLLLRRRRSDDPLGVLTPREREVLELMALGTSNQGIADGMVITLRAAEKYVPSVFDKLGIPSSRQESRRVLAVLLYLRS